MLTKIEFIVALNEKLSVLPKSEVNERLNFYIEMIEDRMEDGLSEDEAVAAVGNVETIANQIISEIPLTKLVKQKMVPKKKLTALEIVLIVLGAPIWVSLLVAAVSVVFSVYIALWSVIIGLWAAFSSVLASGVALSLGGTILSIFKNVPAGLSLIGAGFVCAGLSIFLFYGCKFITKAFLILTKKVVLGIKNRLLKGEGK